MQVTVYKEISNTIACSIVLSQMFMFSKSYVRFCRVYSLVQVGFNKDGKLQAVDLTMYTNDGYISEFGWLVSNVITFINHERLAIKLLSLNRPFQVAWPGEECFTCCSEDVVRVQ